MTMPFLSRKRASFRPQLEALDSRLVPATFVVNNLDDGSDGSLRALIAAAQSGDTITFDSSLQGQAVTLTQHQQIVIDKSLTIQGLGQDKLMIDGGGYYSGSRIFEIDGTTTNVTLSGLSIVQGTGVAYSYSGNVGWGGGGHSGGSATAY